EPVQPSAPPGNLRCRVWCVRTGVDTVYKNLCATWFKQKAAGKIKSSNLQLHPPRFRADNIFKNKCGNLKYPLLFSAVRKAGRYEVLAYNPAVLKKGLCKVVKATK